LYVPPSPGTETFRFILENGAGRQVDVTVTLEASLELPEGDPMDEEPAKAVPEPSGSDLRSWLRLAELQTLAAGFSGTELQVADLSAASVAETTGTGLAARITLDTNAAGHGWYLDPTPQANEEFLPTADPNIWQAKEGSAAAGRMDLLSVLLHEYGHALGFRHSADSRDFMAAKWAGDTTDPT
jgi:hypothetical protein